MDSVWQSAPAFALRLRHDAQGLQVQANEVAARWAVAQGLCMADWQALAADAWQRVAHARARLHVGPMRLMVDVQPVPLDDGSLLLWLQPAAGPLPEGGAGDALDQRTRLVADAMGVGFWSRDIDAGTAHWDEQMYRIHRRAPAAGPPGFDDWITQHVHVQDQSWVTALHRQASATWMPVVDAMFRAPDADVDGDDGERWVQTWTRRLVRDGRRLAFGMHMDVTDRQRAQARVERERARTQFAIAAADVGVWERALDGRATYWNDTMYRLRGLAPDDPRSLAELASACAHPDDQVALQQLLRSHLESGTPYRFEFRVHAPGGGWRWLATHGNVLRGAEGQALGMAGVNLDITERKQADTLRQQQALATQARRDESAFLARVSHELRTPMNAVLGFTQLLNDDSAEPPTARQRERLQRIADAGAQMMVLVDELLDLARLEAMPPATAAAEAPRLADMLQRLHEVPAPAPARTLLGPLPASPPLHVLCVEDNPVNLLLVRELLMLRPGVRLRAATDGGSGIEMALAERPDVLLLDLQLPDIAGLDVLRRLRAEPAMSGCVYVALSANAMPDHIAHARSAGFDDYWTKPIDFERFLSGIDRLAGRGA